MQSLALLLSTVLAGTASASRPLVRVEPTPTEPPSSSIGLLPFAGLGVLVARSGTESYPVGGGLARVTVGSLVLGAVAEASVLPDYSLSYWGGVVGAWVPFRSWVDLDGAVGFGRRTYANRATRSYLGDYRVSLPAATLRLGASDRAGALAGVRLGTQLVATLDVDPQERRWTIAPTDANPEGSSGIRHFGALTLALVITIGLDIEPGYEPPPEPAPSRGRRPPAGVPPPGPSGPWPY